MSAVLEPQAPVPAPPLPEGEPAGAPLPDDATPRHRLDPRHSVGSHPFVPLLVLFGPVSYTRLTLPTIYSV